MPPGSVSASEASGVPVVARNGGRNWACWAALPARSSGVSPSPVENRFSATLGIARDQLLGQRRCRRRPGSVAAEGLRDEPSQEPGLHHLPVEGAGGPVPLGRRGQGVGHGADVGEHVAGELAGLCAQGLRSLGAALSDGHGAQ